MKKLLTLMFLAGGMFVSSQAQYQVANSNFEQWESSGGSGEEPVHWNSFETASGSYSGTVSAVQLYKDTNTRPGSTGTYSAKLTARNVIASIIAQGNMTTGQINGGSMTASDASGNYNWTNVDDSNFNMPFTGRPDALRVWVKFNGGDSSNPYAKVSCYLHGNGYYQDPNTANTNKFSELIASGVAKPTNCDWTEVIVPLTYASNNRPYYALVSFSTNYTPGKGTTSDYLYVDDMEMVYYSDIKSATFNGNAITFSGTHAVVDALYKDKYLKINSGAGADITRTFDTNTNILTIVIKGDNISVDPTNTHTYTIQFNGLDLSADDEPDAIVTPETVANPKAPAAGWFYIKNKQTGYFMNNATNTTSAPHAWYISAANAADVKDADGKYLKIGCSATSHSVSTSGTSDGRDVLFNNVSDSYYQIYSSYAGLMSTYYTYINDDANKLSQKSSESTADNYLWEFYDAGEYDRVNGFWANYQNASLTNGISAMAFLTYNASHGVEAQEVEGLPLGLYSINGGDIFYLTNGSKLTVPAGTTSITYYGRLNLSLYATYDGKAITSGGNVDAIYDASKLVVNLTGNGAQEYTTDFTAETQTLVINVKGYTRSREHEVKFAAPSMTLDTKWYGVSIEANSTVKEEYDATHISFTPGRGTSVTDSSYENGVLTVTITSVYGETKTFTYNFMTYPAVASSVSYTDATKMAQTCNGYVYDDNQPDGITIETLVNGNINFVLNNLITWDSTDNDVMMGNLSAKNIKKDAKGNINYNGNVRIPNGELVQYSVSAQEKDGELYAACTIVYDGISTYFTYGISVDNTKTFTDDIVVTINGDDAGRENSTVTVQYLNNGNINFSLANFKLTGVGNVGDINVNNIPYETNTGEFTYNGDLYIGSGSDYTITDWMGPSLGSIPVVLRGQIISNTLSLVIDIDFREQMSQVIHVTFGCDAVGTPEQFTDTLVVTVNGTSADPILADVVVGHLANGNINFSLKNFVLDGVGAIGNVSIENLSMDATGKFTYNGSIFVSKGDDEYITKWLGPDLGILPIQLEGQLFTAEDGTRSLIVSLDIDFEKQNQTIHVTFGATPQRYDYFTDTLVVTINGASTSKPNTEVTVGYLKNGNINFILKNFVLDGVGGVGNIALDNLTLDANGKFTYNGVTRIGAGDDASITKWLGPELGDVPICAQGQIFTYNDTTSLIVVLDVDMQENLQQTIHVTFGIHPKRTTTYTEDIVVTVNGTASDPEQTIITVGTLGNGNINFSLNDFVLAGGMYVGNIALENLEIDENDKFSFLASTRIGAGTDPTKTWLGPTLGDVPLNLKGQFFSYNDEKHIIVTIDIDMTDTELNQFIHVSVGTTPVTTNNYEGNLIVTVNGADSDPIDTTVKVGTLRNGNLNFILNNFKLNATTLVGNINLDNLELVDGTFTYNGVTRIGAGDDTIAPYASWLGPTLGNVPLDLTGTISGEDLVVDITIDMTETDLQQMIYVHFEGAVTNVLPGDVDGNGEVNTTDIKELVKGLVGLPSSAVNTDVNKDGKFTIADITALIQILNAQK